MLDARYLSLVPVVLLLGGALILWLGGESMGHHFKYGTTLAIASVATISVVYLAFLPQPYDTTLFPWLALRRLSLGFDYHGDGLAIYPSLCALGAGLVLIIFGWAARFPLPASQLGLMLASLAAFVQMLLSGNLLLLYLAGETLTLLWAAQIQEPPTAYVSQGARGLLLGLLQLAGLGLLLAVVLLGMPPGNFALSLVPPAAMGLGIYGLIMVAGAVRGGLYPFHQWLPAAGGRARPPAAGLLLTLAPLAGIYLLARFLFIAGPSPGAEPGLLVLGFLSVVMLPFLALHEASPQRALGCLVAAQGAFVVVALAAEAQANLWRQMVNLTLAVPLTYAALLALEPAEGLWRGIQKGASPWMAWLGGLSLLGLPSPSVGFEARWELYSILWTRGHFLGLGLGLLSQAISLAALIRIIARGLATAPDTPARGAKPVAVLLLVGGLGVALAVDPRLLDEYVVAPALASLSLEGGPAPGGVAWNLALLVLALPLGFLVERYGQRPVPGLEWGRLGRFLEPFPLYTAAGRRLVSLARLVEQGLGLIPQQPALATPLIIGLFILLFMAG